MILTISSYIFIFFIGVCFGIVLICLCVNSSRNARWEERLAEGSDRHTDIGDADSGNRQETG